MKLIVLSVFALIALSFGELDEEAQCEESTYLYSSNCGPILMEPTCNNVHGTQVMDQHVCGYTDCYCNPPTVRDVDSNTCVTLDKCPKPEFETTSRIILVEDNV